MLSPRWSWHSFKAPASAHDRDGSKVAHFAYVSTSSERLKYSEACPRLSASLAAMTACPAADSTSDVAPWSPCLHEHAARRRTSGHVLWPSEEAARHSSLIARAQAASGDRRESAHSLHHLRRTPLHLRASCTACPAATPGTPGSAASCSIAKASACPSARVWLSMYACAPLVHCTQRLPDQAQTCLLY